MLIGAWRAARAAARMRLLRVRFVGLTRAQVRLVARVGGAGPRPPMAEAAVGDYAMMQGAFMHPAGGVFAASAFRVSEWRQWRGERGHGWTWWHACSMSCVDWPRFAALR